MVGNHFFIILAFLHIDVRNSFLGKSSLQKRINKESRQQDPAFDGKREFAIS